MIADAPQAGPLVWTIDAEHAHLYYFPRECPRVDFRAGSKSTPGDIDRFLGLTPATHVAAIEAAWLEVVRRTVIYRYALPGENFELRDAPAGYYIARRTVRPLEVGPIPDLLLALSTAGVELRITPSLWPLYEAVISSTLEFSVVRWRNAAAK